MKAIHALSFSAAERNTVLTLARARGAEVHWGSPEPHPHLPSSMQLGEFAQVVGPEQRLDEDCDGEPVAFTIQKTGDSQQRFVRLGHDGHPQATGRSLNDVLWSLLLGSGSRPPSRTQDPEPLD